MTAVCAILFMTNSLVLAYMSSQSDSRRLQRIAEKKAQAKKAEDATNAKMLTDIEKQREAQEKAAAQKSEAEPSSEPAEGTPGEDKADDKAPAVTGKAAELKPTPSLQLKLPEGLGSKSAPGAAGKLAKDLKLGKAEKPAADSKLEKPEKPAAEKKVSNVVPAPKKKAPAEKAGAVEQSGAERKPATEDRAATEDKPAAEAKPAAERKPAATKKPAAEKKSDENSAEKPAAE